MSDSGKLLSLFMALPHKAYVYGANGKRRKDVVPKLGKDIPYEVPASGHALMSDKKLVVDFLASKLGHDVTFLVANRRT